MFAMCLVRLASRLFRLGGALLFAKWRCLPPAGASRLVQGRREFGELLLQRGNASLKLDASSTIVKGIPRISHAHSMRQNPKSNPDQFQGR